MSEEVQQSSSRSINLMRVWGISGAGYSEAGFTAISQLLKIKLHMLQVRGFQGISL